MPEHDHTARATQETRTIHHVGYPFFERPEQDRVVARIVFEIGILDEQDLTLGSVKACAYSCALTLILLMQNNTDFILAVHFFQQVTRAINRAIIDQHDFPGKFG